MAEKVFLPPFSDVHDYKMYIDGQWVASVDGEMFESFNPYTKRPWARAPKSTQEDVNQAVEAAHAAFEGGWGTTPAHERARILRQIGDLLANEEVMERLAIIEVMDNGKLIKEMLGQASSFSSWFYYYAGLAQSMQGDTIPVNVPDMINFTLCEPLGVVGAIVPWNSPLLLSLWKLCPALAAGNTVVIKPSEYAPAGLLEFMRIIEESDVPPGVINVATGFGDAGEALVKHPLVMKVAFTGSGATGRAVMKNAAGHLAKVSLELGGKSPNIVFDDADLANALNGVLAGIFAATGQTCMAGSRVLLQHSVYDQFTEALVERAGSIQLGDPLDMATEMGTVASQAQFDKVLKYIEIGQGEGATVLHGGHKASAPELETGWFIEPTVFGDVHNDMRIAQEEIFGPVVCLIPFKDEAHAISIANDTPFGLAAAVWTDNLQRSMRMVQQLRAGTVWVNNYRKVSYSSPFGGYGDSGIGRENGLASMDEYCQTKSVWVDTGSVVADPFGGMLQH